MFLLLVAAAGVAILHSIMPDHWVPLTVVARTNRWSMTRVARVTFLASLGHIVASVVLAGIIAAIGLRFRQVIEHQQGHIVGIVLILTGFVFLVLRLMGKGGHSHGDEHGHSHHHHGHTYPFEWGGIYQLSAGEYHFVLDKGPDPEMKIALFRVGGDSSHELDHACSHGVEAFKGASRRVSSGESIEPGESRCDLVLNGPDDFAFQIKDPGYYVLFTEHHPEEFSAKVMLEETSISVLTHKDYPSAHEHGSHDEPKTLLKRIAAIAVPFGIAASPDLTILPVALAASAVSTALVVGTLVVFAVFTIATFLILTLAATKLGYQIKGDWLEKNAITINAVMLIAIGGVAYVGF